MFKILIIFFCLIFFLRQAVFAENIQAFVFSKEEMKNLKVKKVKGLTSYSLGSNEKGNYLRAETEGKGSGLGKEVKIDLLKGA